MFNGQVGDAAPGIEPVRRGDRPGGAYSHAARAISAAVGQRRVGWNFERCEHLGQEKPRAEFWMDQHRAFALPACAGKRTEVALQHRPRIGVITLNAAVLLQKRVDLLELRLDEIVVIIIPRITGDAIHGALGFRVALPVIHCQHHHAFRARQHKLRVCATVRVAFHPRHLSGASFCKPLPKVLRMRRLHGGSHAAKREPERTRKLGESLFHSLHKTVKGLAAKRRKKHKRKDTVFNSFFAHFCGCFH